MSSYALRKRLSAVAVSPAELASRPRLLHSTADCSSLLRLRLRVRVRVRVRGRVRVRVRVRVKVRVGVGVRARAKVFVRVS